MPSAPGAAGVASAKSMTDAAGRKQVFFHVGAPKTGSTYLQELLWTNRERLAADGVCYPLTTYTENLAAVIDLCQRRWGGRWKHEWSGAWERIATTMRAWDGPTVVFSAELMGLATPEQAARAVASVQPADVHVVFTARDLARQLPSDWQEQVKHRHTVTLTKFVDDLVKLGHDAPSPFGELFWGLHDAAFVLDKWRDVVPPKRVHVVTVPRSGAPPDQLWRRLAGVFGIAPDAYDMDSLRHNTSMGLVETEFLRRFNGATRDLLSQEHGPVLNRTLGQEILAARPEAVPIRLPAEHYEWVARRSRLMADEVTRRGYHIVGDIEELTPAPRSADEENVVAEQLAPAVINQAAYFAVAGLVDEVLSLRGRLRNTAERLEVFAPGALDEVEAWRTESAQQRNDQLPGDRLPDEPPDLAPQRPRGDGDAEAST